MNLVKYDPKFKAGRLWHLNNARWQFYYIWVAFYTAIHELWRAIRG